jgi:hypothetical protein
VAGLGIPAKKNHRAYDKKNASARRILAAFAAVSVRPWATTAIPIKEKAELRLRLFFFPLSFAG